MQRFLEICASYVFQKYENHLSELCLVFPNRRAGVFFNAYLRKQLTRPVIGPKTITVQKFMLDFSDILPADPLKLITLLYEIFLEETGYQETLDAFYFWGEVLLSDFDDIDKYLVNADRLFSHVASLKDIDRLFDYLTQEQKKVIGHFWGTLQSWEKYQHEKQFITFWEKLSSIYNRFREKLTAEGLGYSGMIIRDGVDRLESGKAVPPCRKYLFFGLNALNACEKRVFSLLKSINKADFFWDYDNYYLKNPNNPAGRFIRENIGLFPAPDDFKTDNDFFSKPHRIELVAFASRVAQAQVIPAAFKDIPAAGETSFDQTAIVLADESLLFHVLGAIPANQYRINVTMGFPLKNSPVTGLLLMMANLIRNTNLQDGAEPDLYHKPVTDILSHQILRGFASEKVNAKMEEIRKENRIYIKPSELDFSEVHRKIFTLPVRTADFAGYYLEILKLLFENSDNHSFNPFLRDTIYATYLAIEKLKVATDPYSVPSKNEISPGVFFRMMIRFLNQVTVPFEGEPLGGIQVMGILETRCLDFENLIIIGLNEDTWPRDTTTPSLIPFSLRKGFGLPVSDDQDGIYAYYFYRLNQRAGKITATWNTVREGLTGGELSRFGFQLMFLSPHPVIRKNYDLPLRGSPPGKISVSSSAEIVTLLLRRYTGEKALSPSAITSFLTCSLKFYFRYIADLKEPEEVTEDIDRQLFGNIFHKAAESLFRPYIGQEIDSNVFDKLLKDDKTIENVIREAFNTEVFYRPAHEFHKMSGKFLLIASTIDAYIRNLLRTEQVSGPVYIHALEKHIETLFDMQTGEGIRRIRIGGITDRLDEKNGFLRIVDYKTGTLGNSDLQFRSVEEIFSPEAKKIRKEILQALLYAMILKRSYFPDRQIRSAVYAILNLANRDFNPSVRMNNREVETGEIAEEFEQYLTAVLERIFSADTFFRQTDFIDRCRYCPYKELCRR